MLIFKVENKNLGIIEGQFTRQYINDIILPGEVFIASADAPCFNFKNVEVCDSAGVALIIHWWRVAFKNNKQVSFDYLSDKMLSIMHASSIEVEDNKLKI